MHDATSALEPPSAPLTDPALLAAAGFLAGYSGTTRAGYTIDLRNYWTWLEQHGLAPFDVRRPHIELYVRSLEDHGYRVSLDRHAAYIVAAFVAGATNGR